MCTDEQWTPREPTQALMISKFWKKFSDAAFQRAPDRSFWLTPMDVPPEENSYKFSFPQVSQVCRTHTPAKLK
jgi:hypothetical protein